MGQVSEEWNAISSEICQNLIESIPRKIQAVIKAKGGHTKHLDSKILDAQKNVPMIDDFV